MKRLQFPPPRVTGFPSICDDFAHRPLNLHERVVPSPEITIFAQMRGDAMRHRRIPDGALLVIERRSSFSPGQIVLAWFGEDHLLRNLETRRGRAVLCACPDTPVIQVTEDVRLIGLLRWSINRHCDGQSDLLLVG